jgi:aspartyl protease family protein
MLRLAAVGMVGAISAAAAAQTVISYSRVHDGASLRDSQGVASSPAAPQTADLASTEPAQGATAQVVKAADGHYWAEADVNGHEVKFLIDTGATAVSLTTDDARRLGIEPASLDYNAKVITANGPARAARVKLDSVSVAGAQVRDVDALVIENGLQTSLLGMTYLGRLSQFEATQTGMILRP